MLLCVPQKVCKGTKILMFPLSDIVLPFYLSLFLFFPPGLILLFRHSFISPCVLLQAYVPQCCSRFHVNSLWQLLHFWLSNCFDALHNFLNIILESLQPKNLFAKKLYFFTRYVLFYVETTVNMNTYLYVSLFVLFTHPNTHEHFSSRILCLDLSPSVFCLYLCICCHFYFIFYYHVFTPFSFVVEWNCLFCTIWSDFGNRLLFLFYFYFCVRYFFSF